MKPAKPLFMKTYGKQNGKQKRELSAWDSLQNRKQVFDSTSEDLSAQEVLKTARIRRKNRNLVKTKAPARPTIEDEENVFPQPEPPSCKKTTARKIQGTGREVRSAKRKAMLNLFESSDEENIGPSTLIPQPSLRRKPRAKKTQLCSDKTTQSSNEKAKLSASVTSEGESSAATWNNVQQSNTVQKDSDVHVPFADHYVSHRRCTISACPRPLKAPLHILNSSEEFTSGRGSSQIIRSSKRKISPSFLDLSRDNSVNAAGFPGFATNLLQELSSSESTEQSLGPCSRKPIFCSTPSAASLSQKVKQKRFDPISSPPAMSLSFIGPGSTFQQALGSPEQSAPSISSNETPPVVAQIKKPSQSRHEESAYQIFKRLKSTCERTNSSGAAKSQSEEQQTQDSQELPSDICIDSDTSSYYMSAIGEPEWLLDPLKKKCLTQLCTVRLEKFEYLALTQVFGEAICLSCMDSLLSQQDKEHSHPQVISDTTDQTESHVHDAVFMTDSKRMEHSLSDGCKRSMNKPTLDVSSEFKCLTNSHRDLVGELQVQKTTEDLSTVTKNKCAFSTINLSLEASLSGNDSPNSSIAVLQSQPDQLDSEEQAEALAKVLKEKCLNDKHTVKIKKMSVTEIKGYLQDVENRKKLSVGPKEKKRRRLTKRTGTSRKACVSGLSVSRWKNKDVFRSNFAHGGGTTSVDCSISELIPSQQRQPVEQFGYEILSSTPGKDINLSSLLTEASPGTHAWRRLKAALSVHRKVMLTPRTPCRGSTVGLGLGLTEVSQDAFASPLQTPRSRHLHSQRLSFDSKHVSGNDNLLDAEKVYAECGQQGPLAWEQCILPQRMKQCLKIGEGTFGEVFCTSNEKGDTVALKVIPVEGSVKVNGEEQKSFAEILHEIIISKELSSLKEKQENQTHGFIGLHDLHCVRGCYPPDFLKAWDKFDQQRNSENDRPDFFAKDQLFLILEFEFGGSDLENSNGTLKSLLVAKSILQQVTAALSVAEQELHFEHRDLHWGNVLVKNTMQKSSSFTLNGRVHHVETKGVLVRIIDYSLSRLEIDELTVSCDISMDEELFMGQGDYQFEIYRIMRRENGNNWTSYNPHTNVLWLHYLCSKLLFMKYCGSGGKHAKAVREELTCFYENVLQYSSATEVLQNCPLFR